MDNFQTFLNACRNGQKNIVKILLERGGIDLDRRDAEGNVLVEGYVIDELGEPIIGAAVTIVGSTTGVVSGADGKFNIAAPEGSKLKVMYVGYKLAEVKADPIVTVKLVKE